MIESFSKNPSFQLLLTATEQLIKEKGCKNTTLKDIIEQTGLSKGAIYHYVSSKDELLGLILQAKVQEMNEAFQESVKEAREKGHSMDPFQMIAKGLFNNSENGNVSNTIFIYLLSQTDNPKIEKILHSLYDYSYHTGVRWIETGQERDAIPDTIDAQKMVSMFMLISYGLRVQKIVAPESSTIDVNDMFSIIFHSLAKGTN
jgi:AcrR family transcriptional regulator